MGTQTGLDWLEVSLRGYGGEAPSGSSFFDAVQLSPDAGFQAFPSASAWQGARIQFFVVAMGEDSKGSNEPTEDFAIRVREGFDRAAAWLATRALEMFDGWRAMGKEVDVFVAGWLVNEQLDLELPSPFLLQCGRLGLPIRICTND